jgi:hypothetical protein
MQLKKYQLALAVLATASACSNDNANHSALEAKKIVCPEGSQLEYRPWGQNGVMAICQIAHGPVAMAENGRVVIEGENSMGKQSGEWRWLDANGKVERTEQH